MTSRQRAAAERRINEWWRLQHEAAATIEESLELLAREQMMADKVEIAE
jgi:hypothetical protein